MRNFLMLLVLLPLIACGQVDTSGASATENLTYYDGSLFTDSIEVNDSFAMVAWADTTERADSLLYRVQWEETSPGSRRGYLLRFDPYGPFEEDAGESPNRKVRYLQGQWTADSLLTELTLSVDYFLGQSTVHRRYRQEQDFYIPYRIEGLTADRLILRDTLTDELRTFVARPLAGPDAATRRARKIELKQKDDGGFKIPKGW